MFHSVGKFINEHLMNSFSLAKTVLLVPVTEIVTSITITENFLVNVLNFCVTAKSNTFLNAVTLLHY